MSGGESVVSGMDRASTLHGGVAKKKAEVSLAVRLQVRRLVCVYVCVSLRVCVAVVCAVLRVCGNGTHTSNITHTSRTLCPPRRST